MSLFLALFVYIMRCKSFRRHCLILRVNFHHRKGFISCIIVSLWLYSLDVLESHGPFIVYDKLGSRSFIVIYLQARSNEVFIMVTDLDIRFKHLIDGSCCYFLEQNRLNFFLPWKMPINHFISDNSNTPNITFVGVSIEFQRFRRHIIGRTHIVVKLLQTSIRMYGKAKISKLYYSLSNEDISKFKISMNNTHFIYLSVCIQKLFEYGLSLSFSQLLFFT